MSLLTAQVPVSHKSFVPNAAGGRHGTSNEGTLSAAVARFAYQVYPKAWGGPRPDMVTPESAAITETDMLLDVPDPMTYKRRDTVTIHGVSYEVQGRPENWGDGLLLFPQYDSVLGGGTVLIRRID